MNPYLHHVRVFAEWSLRRPIPTVFAAAMVAAGALLTQERAFGQLDGLGAGLLIGGALGPLGLMIGALGGPTRDGFRLRSMRRPMPTLPMKTGWRSLGEVVGTLLIAVPLVVPLAALLGLIHAGLASDLHAGLASGVCMMLPAMLVGRRIESLGTADALGPITLAAGATIVLAMIGPSPALLPATALVGALALRWTPHSEELAAGLQGLWDGFTEVAPPSRRPWHTDTRRVLRSTARTIGPILLLAAALSGGLALWAIQRAPELAMPILVVVVSPLFLLAAAPMLLPLGFDSRTALRTGRSDPFDGSFRRAWQLLPVEPVALRRTALRNSLGGVIPAWLGLFGMWWFVDPTSSMAALAAPVGVISLTMAPMLVGMALGSVRDQRWAMLLATTTVVAMLPLALAPSLVPRASAISWMFLAAAAVLAVGLTASLLRRSDDEAGERNDRV